MAEVMELPVKTPECINHTQERDMKIGLTPFDLCEVVTEDTSMIWDHPRSHGTYPVFWTSLWMCRQHGWPYLSANWTNLCAWGWAIHPRLSVPCSE